MSLPGFSVRHSVVANMITLFVIVVGIYVTLFTLRRDVFPETELNLVFITTVYADASPTEVEDLITVPIEDALREIDDLEFYRSITSEGLSRVFVQIVYDVDNVDRVINEIQRAVDGVDDLPEGAERPRIRSLTTAQPVINVGVFGGTDERALRREAERIKRRLEQLPGVGAVSRSGWRDEEFFVEADLERLLELEVSLEEIAGAIARRNVNLPGGRLTDGVRDHLVRTIGKVEDEEGLSEIVVRSNPDGSRMLVRDVAEARRGFAEDAAFARAGGERMIVLGVKKRERADVLAVARAVKGVVEEERERGIEGLDFVFLDDASFYVERRLRVLINNAWVGMSLVLLFLYVFVPGRAAFITALGIPFSFLAAFLAMAFFGITLNLMTMFGLIIVLGMVVDDAIIVGENVSRHLEMGKSPREAAVVGTNEVMYPVVSTVLTSVAAFLPLIFAPDLYGEYLQWLVYIVIIALGASLLECLVVMPAHFADWMPRQDKVRHPREHRIMHGLQRLYLWSMRPVLRWRYAFLVVTAVVFAGLVTVSVRHLRIEIFPDDLIDVFFVQAQMPVGTALEETDRIVQELYERVARLEGAELDAVVAYVGMHREASLQIPTYGANLAQLMVYLTPQDRRARRTHTIMDEVREWLQEVEGVEQLVLDTLKAGPPTGRPVEMLIVGPDFAVAQQIAEEIEAALAEIPGVTDIQNDLDGGLEEIRIRIREAEARRLGVHVDQAARTIFAGLRGVEATKLYDGRDELVVRVRLNAENRAEPETLLRMRTPNEAGRLIELGRIVEVERAESMPVIRHYNGERVVTVGASVNTEIASATEVSLAMERRFADVPSRFPGYSIEPSGEWKETRKIVDFMKVAFVVAVFLIYSIMVIQFNSFFQPLVVLTSIPLGLIGVAVALALHGKPVSMMALMGGVGLGGVVVNDAIVLVSFINRRRQEGIPVVEAVLDAGVTRLRPILMTSVTTIAGLMPTIYGWGGYEPFIVPAAITLAYGLLFATFLTLAVVPVIYLVGMDVKGVFRGRMKEEG